MAYYLGLVQLIGIHTLLGLSAYVLMLTGQLSLGQAGFFAIGAYTAGILTVIFELPILPALLSGACIAAFFAFLVGFPALRVKGLMLVVATIAFSEFVRLFFFNLSWRVPRGDIVVGPDSTNGFREIRYFVANGWSAWEITIFVWVFVILVMALLFWTAYQRVRWVATGILVPMMIAPVVVGFTARMAFNNSFGFLNQILSLLWPGDVNIQWLSDPTLAPVVIATRSASTP